METNLPSILTISILALCFLQTSAEGITLDVFPDGTGPYPTIQSAIDAAQPLDTVRLSPGTYQGQGNRGFTFHGKDLVLKGYGVKEEIIIDCEYLDVGIRLQNGETSYCILEGFTVSRGENHLRETGGGVLCENSSPTIRNLVIRDCRGTHDAGLLLAYSSATLENVVFSGNEASGVAGAIGIYWANPSLQNVQFVTNTAGYVGGSVYCGLGSSGHFENCQFENSSASQEGGAIFLNTGSTTQFQHCSFIDNNGKYGGAVYSGPASPTFIACLFEGNNAEVTGGAIRAAYPSAGPPILLSLCQFISNTGGAGGGGIVSSNGAILTLQGCTIAGNSGSEVNGAGLSCFTSSNMEVEDCLIAFNSGPGILVGPSDASVGIACSDVYGNEENYSGAIEDQTSISGNISEDPLFCGYTNWVLTLAEQSPCLPENNDCGVLMGALGMDCTLTGVGETQGPDVQLLPCYPNPFNPRTTISLELDEPGEIRLAIHDVAGRQINILHEGWLDTGRRDLIWSGLDQAGLKAPSGVYFVVLDGPNGRSSQKLTLLR